MIEDMKNKHGKIGTWALVVLALLVVGSGAYFLIHPQTSSPTGIATTTQPVTANAYGMVQYIDPDFGFTFWYPSSWQILKATMKDTTSFPGGTLVKTLQVGPAGGVTISVVNSTAQTITDEQRSHASPIGQTKYFYNSAAQQWMVAYPEGERHHHGEYLEHHDVGPHHAPQWAPLRYEYHSIEHDEFSRCE